ncbi:MAG TPA: hypothetical protein PL009_09245, partial [Flavipsychrobacter sp.]|nr:hypothetical protein [Flavipsychrobacter sp.]
TTSTSINKIGLQSDVFPTVMSLVLPGFVNNTFGIDLMRNSHPYIVFSADDKLACMNDSLLYVYRNHAAASLYKYQNNNTADFSNELPTDVTAMRNVAFSWLQTSGWLLRNNRSKLQ